MFSFSHDIRSQYACARASKISGAFTREITSFSTEISCSCASFGAAYHRGDDYGIVDGAAIVVVAPWTHRSGGFRYEYCAFHCSAWSGIVLLLAVYLNSVFRLDLPVLSAISRQMASSLLSVIPIPHSDDLCFRVTEMALHVLHRSSSSGGI